MSLRRSDFRFDLPDELIAQAPPARRTDSRLLCLLDGVLVDRRITELPTYVEPNDLLVFNDTRVLAARLLATKETGGRVEIMVERLLGEHEALAQLRSSKPSRAGSVLTVDGCPARVHVEGRDGDFFRLRVEGMSFAAVLDEAGHVPLPPYIARADRPADRERYQTVFARQPGAVAAPTAGLHFDEALIAALRDRGADMGFVTLHVGAGTFQPVRVEDLSTHRMHRERLVVDERLCQQVARTRSRGGRVIAIGTTVVRSLETAARDGSLRPFQGETDLFITPGFRFNVVDALLTNFHLPESTLLMLVCAFAGRERVLAAYEHAVRARYRFFSYGDAMFIPRRQKPSE